MTQEEEILDWARRVNRAKEAEEAHAWYLKEVLPFTKSVEELLTNTRIGHLHKLDGRFTASCEYRPEDVTVPFNLPSQTIEIYPPPTYIMSPRTRLYRASDIIRMRGHLWSCMFPSSFENGERPEATITITPTEDKES